LKCGTPVRKSVAEFIHYTKMNTGKTRSADAIAATALKNTGKARPVDATAATAHKNKGKTRTAEVIQASAPVSRRPVSRGHQRQFEALLSRKRHRARIVRLASTVALRVNLPTAVYLFSAQTF
jgi:hypothetical protein